MPSSHFQGSGISKPVGFSRVDVKIDTLQPTRAIHSGQITENFQNLNGITWPFCRGDPRIQSPTHLFGKNPTQRNCWVVINFCQQKLGPRYNNGNDFNGEGYLTVHEQCQLFLASWCETTLTVLPPFGKWSSSKLMMLMQARSLTKLKHKAVRLTWISQKASKWCVNRL